jgi:hypothetical protein
MDFPGRTYCPDRIILMGGLGTKERYNGVPDEFLNHSFVLPNDLGNVAENPTGDFFDLLRIEFFGERGVTAQVGEKDSHGLSLAL